VKNKKKTNKSVSKRFKVTATGKVMRRRSGKAHLLSSKNKDRKRRLSKDAVVYSADAWRIKTQIGKAK
jgi:large subunit ribosomal protein L35